MLAISHAQLDLLRDSRESECIARLEQSLRLSFPRDVARLSEQQLRSHVGPGIKRCRARGWKLCWQGCNSSLKANKLRLPARTSLVSLDPSQPCAIFVYRSAQSRKVRPQI